VVPLRSIERLEVSRGKRPAVLEGLVIGAVTGAVHGSLAGGGSSGARSGPAVMVALMGAGMGSVIGLLVWKDRWERVDIQRRPRVGLGLVPGPGPAAGLRVSF
jgi:hypothetical protein